MWSSLFSPLYSWVAHICGLFFWFGIWGFGFRTCFLFLGGAHHGLSSESWNKGFTGKHEAWYKEASVDHKEPLLNVQFHRGAVPPAVAWLELGTTLRRVKGNDRPQQGTKETGKETDVNHEPPLVHLDSLVSWTITPATTASTTECLCGDRSKDCTVNWLIHYVIRTYWKTSYDRQIHSGLHSRSQIIWNMWRYKTGIFPHVPPVCSHSWFLLRKYKLKTRKLNLTKERLSF